LTEFWNPIGARHRLDQDGTAQRDRHVAKIIHLMSRAADWPECRGLIWEGSRKG